MEVPSWDYRIMLAPSQMILVTQYLVLQESIADLENEIVDCQVDASRERDLPRVKIHRKDIAEAQEDLQTHKIDKERVERALKREEERLRNVVGGGETLAKAQAKKLRFYLGKDIKTVCLR
ncbi:hypothetical protein GMOD_00000721 [Pyrenophora seminiperda CCB06]|uniref:Uncharacterized protein n=1 Tax=Pyrenophora seminiperda CCB06 TaxID=1302712 RepID=A0A3M7M889_9PLEO|nr:hypothetical protein GMOD_00000721 [Pyrenophora seminiperda CCB06]